MTEYARGIEQATALYKEVIQGCKLENAKLRELVLDIWKSGYLGKTCVNCEIRGECYTEIEEAYKKGSGRWNVGCLFVRRIEDRMRELGIEVE